MNRHFILRFVAVKTLLLLAACTAVPYEEHYMLRSEYYRSLEEANRRNDAEKDTLRERIATLQADQGREEGRRLQLESEVERLKTALAAAESRLSTLTLESERSAAASRREIGDLLATIDRLEKDLEAAKAREERVSDTPVVLLPDLAFAAGSKRLEPEALQRLRDAKNELVVAAQVSVIGYADAAERRGTGYDSPWSLSASRAAEVVNFLVRELQVPETRINAVARGALDPVVREAKTDPDRQKNRRVQVVVIYR